MLISPELLIIIVIIVIIFIIIIIVIVIVILRVLLSLSSSLSLLLLLLLLVLLLLLSLSLSLLSLSLSLSSLEILVLLIKSIYVGCCITDFIRKKLAFFSWFGCINFKYVWLLSYELYRSISDNFMFQYLANKWINFWVIFCAWMNWPTGTVHWSPVTARRILDICHGLSTLFVAAESSRMPQYTPVWTAKCKLYFSRCHCQNHSS